MVLEVVLMMRSRSTTSARAALRTLAAKSAKNEFALANDSLAEKARGWIRHVVPLDVFDFTAAIADEMMMTHAFRVVTRGATFDRDLTHETRLHQVAKIVVRGGARRARVAAIDGFESFGRRRMGVLIHQKIHPRVTLRSTS